MKKQILFYSLFLSCILVPNLILPTSESATERAERLAAHENPFADLDEQLASYKPELFDRTMRPAEINGNRDDTQPLYLVPSEINTFDSRPMVPSLVVNAFCTDDVPPSVRDLYENHKEAFDHLLQTPYPTTQLGKSRFPDAQAGPVTMSVQEGWFPILRAKAVSDAHAMEQSGLQNKNGSWETDAQGNRLFKHGANYVFRTDDGWYLKISGPGNRFAISACTEHKEAIINIGGTLTLCKRPTYQTLSRIAGYLRISELQKKKMVSHIKIPEFKIFRPQADQPASDENCIVVESEMNAHPITTLASQSSPAINLITEKHMRDLITTIKYAGFWDTHNPDNVRLNEDGDFVLCDTEQRNRQSRFFYGNKDIVPFCIGFGLSGAHKIFTAIPQLKPLWEAALLKDSQAMKFIENNTEFADLIAQRTALIQRHKASYK